MPHKLSTIIEYQVFVGQFHKQSLLLMEYKTDGIALRNGNGVQFIAGVVRQILKGKGVNQEFTNVVKHLV